jgi:putative FmdB family regulatory protein
VPTYQYACTECGEQLEVVQKFSDNPLTVCPACEGRLRKVFSPVGIVFKGSGFYRTDSRSGNGSAAKEKAGDSSSADSKSDSGSKSDSAKSDSKTTAKGDSKTTAKDSSSSSSAPKASGSSGSAGEKVA